MPRVGKLVSSCLFMDFSKTKDETIKHFDECLRSAEGGNAESQAQMGDFFVSGKVVAAEYQRALKWYRLAVEQGQVSSRSSLGFMYAQGQGVPTDTSLHTCESI